MHDDGPARAGTGPIVAGRGARSEDGRHRGRRTRVAAVVAGVVTSLVVVLAVVVVALDEVPWGGSRTVDRSATVAEPVAATGAVLDRWYERRAQELDLQWRPVGARLTDGDGSVTCDGDPVLLDDRLRDNAFATWCPEGPLVAVDPGRFPAVDVATQVVLAHEWAHVLQMGDPSIDLPSTDARHHPAERELQADCIAGAWAADHVVGEFHGLMLARVGSFGDPRWVAVDDEQGHGTSRERAAAYELGVHRGLAACLPPGFDPR